MRKALLASILLFAAFVAFGHQRKTTKPKTKPKHPASEAKWEQYTPCGVYYKDVLDFMSDLNKEWQLVGTTKSDEIFHDPDRTRCTENGILKAWIKRMHKASGLKYSLVLYELKCKTDELRVRSTTEYDKDGAVLESDDSSNSSWSDAVPESVGEMILKAACRTPE